MLAIVRFSGRPSHPTKNQLIEIALRDALVELDIKGKNANIVSDDMRLVTLHIVTSLGAESQWHNIILKAIQHIAWSPSLA